ncbi:Src-like 3 domains [Teratosphaeria destructans]|uniref:Src-like 3 domains n=1 Tax=Teratosphaeria destructans TaxID=418781 RepID=A0A9W7T1D2_9PEZI|nr:Src-like 3 domains [Teratosphaeria destructans]
MAEVLSPPPHPSPASTATTASTTSPQPPPPPRIDSPDSTRSRLSQSRWRHSRDRVPSRTPTRLSHYSQQSRRSSRSRPRSSNLTTLPAFQSSLSYALVRDFAYDVFHPMHYGAPPELESETSTPGSEWYAGRRMSDSMESGSGGSGGAWSAGPWGGDGSMYADPSGEEGIEALPSTSFGDDGESVSEKSDGRGKKHRKSKSYADITDYERGRRRESTGYRRSRQGADEMFLFSGQQTDPAGRDSLRQSRSYGQPPSTVENGHTRRDSHFQTMLPSRSFGHSQQNPQPIGPVDPDSDLPLDREIPTSPNHSPNQRQSIGPDDEDLYAGQSLALYTFEPENANELRLTEGQVIMVSYRHGQGWLVAEDPRTGEQGLVPEAYVRLLSDLPHYDPETGTFQDLEDGEEGTQRFEDAEEDVTGESFGSGGGEGEKDGRVDEVREESDDR